MYSYSEVNNDKIKANIDSCFTELRKDIEKGLKEIQEDFNVQVEDSIERKLSVVSKLVTGSEAKVFTQLEILSELVKENSR